MPQRNTRDNKRRDKAKTQAFGLKEPHSALLSFFREHDLYIKLSGHEDFSHRNFGSICLSKLAEALEIPMTRLLHSMRRQNKLRRSEPITIDNLTYWNARVVCAALGDLVHRRPYLPKLRALWKEIDEKVDTRLTKVG